MSNFFSSEVQALLDLESCKCSSKNDSSRLAFLSSSLKFGKILSKISGFCRINMPKNKKIKEKRGISQPNELVEIQLGVSEVQFSGGKKPIENSNPVTTNKPNPVPKKILRATVAGVLIISPQYTS